MYYPYLLKEYRNRWFLVRQSKKAKTLITLALDRIEDLAEMAKSGFVEYEGVDFEKYYADTIGITKNEKDRGQRVILRMDSHNAPYVLTKPIHASQQLLNTEDDGSILIRLDVVLNFELEREILGFGECITVLSPKILRDRIRRKAYKMLQQYTEPN